MTAPRRVVAYLGPEQIAEGYYTYDGVTLRMVYANGAPVKIDDEPVTETVTPDQAEAVAKKLTKRIRKSMRGELVEGFSRSLTYEREVFA